MQPNTPQQQPQYSVDYLNSIAPAVKQTTLSPWILWGMIAGVLLLVGVVVLMILSSGTSDKATLTTLAARMSSLQTVTSNSQKSIQSSELRTLNSSLTLVLADINRDLATQVEAQDINLKKDEKAKAVEAEITKLEEELEEARLNAVFDRTYAREMTFYLKTIRSQMSVVATDADSSLRKVLVDAAVDLDSLIEDFSAYNAD